MEFLYEYGLFFAKTVTFVIAIAVVVAVVMSASLKMQGHEKEGHLEVNKLNDKLEDIVDDVKSVVIDQELLKLEHKEHKKKEKEEKKQAKALAKEAKKQKKLQPGETSEGDSDSAQQDSDTPPKKRVFVTDFEGDIKASATENLRKVITAILALANQHDEVVVRLESPGGMVHGYGLAASQLARITDKKIPLTVCVDKVAASGGYMMACVADKIISAPFAVIGSIGVVAQLPNFNKLLKKNDIDYELYTAGEYKRTVTMFGENTLKGKKKFIEDLEDTHELFKEFVREHRAQLDIEKVATGEIWFGKRALEHKLIDTIQTSDQYLVEACEQANVFEIRFVEKKSLAEKLGISVETALDRVVSRWLQKIQNKFLM